MTSSASAPGESRASSCSAAQTPGSSTSEHYARPVLRRWKTRGRVQHLVVDGAGHTFSPPEAQRALRELLFDFAARQTPPDPA